ncbi:hypothetical protein Cob_v012495 [Colletotrichum orbiculare MAFF 240422]|uniref:Uncharacterized protein n=1 Tax=Colletotrichum orbiculare (strain 104-T / ATCC 96160 / CBS 514.97 / LARS 414 / MAFF 240422) TaxID=1213857 RepID=A0A484FAP0_COLOR|nr:hypothetical protein Cob_v012495 [Colletotrichum orbiculare MAFF 240422]
MCKKHALPCTDSGDIDYAAMKREIDLSPGQLCSGCGPKFVCPPRDGFDARCCVWRAYPDVEADQATDDKTENTSLLSSPRRADENAMRLETD